MARVAMAASAERRHGTMAKGRALWWLDRVGRTKGAGRSVEHPKSHKRKGLSVSQKDHGLLVAEWVATRAVGHLPSISTKGKPTRLSNHPT